MPSLDPYPGHTPLSSESVDVEYEELPEGERVCPEQQANLFSSKYYFLKIPRYLFFLRCGVYRLLFYIIRFVNSV